MIHSFLHFILNLIIVILDLFQLICIIIILTYDFSRFEMMEFLRKNWSQNLIKKIKIEYQDQDIQQYNSFENIEPLINISFPGTISGCDCLSYNDEILKGKCPNKLLDKCSDIKPLDSYFLNTLYLPEIKSYSNKGIIIYIERYDNLSYLDLLNSTENEDYFISDNQGCKCEKNYKICIDCGVIDSLENHLCITSYKGISSNCYKLNLEYDYSLKDIKFIQGLESLFNINNKNNNFKFPIEFITTFSDNKICLLKDETISSPLINYNLIYWNNLTSMINPYLKNRGCASSIFHGIKYDNRWKSFYTLSMEYLLDSNLKKDIYDLPLFPYDDFIKKNFSLAYRNYIGFNIRCRNKTKFIDENFASYEQFLKLKFILYLFFAMVFFPCFLIFLMMVSQTDVLNFIQRLIICSAFSANIFIFIECLIYEWVDMNDKNEKIKKIAVDLCWDYLTNNLFFCILEDFKKLQKYVLYCYYWTILMFAASIIKIILVFTKHFKNRIMHALNFGRFNFITEVEIQLLN